MKGLSTEFLYALDFSTFMKALNSVVCMKLSSLTMTDIECLELTMRDVESKYSVLFS